MVDRRWLGTSVVRVRVLAAGLVVLAAGCAVLGWGSRSRQTAANVSAGVTADPATLATSATETPATTPAGLLTAAPDSPRKDSAELKSRARSLFAGLPLIFEPNLGQGTSTPPTGARSL